MTRTGPTKPGSQSGRAVARRVLQRVRADSAFTSLALDAELTRAHLPERDRKLATELCYGVCRHLTRLDRAIASAASRGKVKVKPAVRAALRVGAYQLLFLDRVPAHAAVDDAVGAARRIGGEQVAGFVNSLLRRLARTGEPALPSADRPVEYARVAHSLPDWIAERLATSLGQSDEFLAGAAGFNQRPSLAIRANRARVSADDLAGILRAEKPGCTLARSLYCPDALLATGLGDPQASPSFAGGLWTVQDIGAQLVTHFLGDLMPPADAQTDAPPDKPAILDACAGVGGKALHLAERTSAIIDASDVSDAKLERLRQAAERLGVAGRIRTVTADLSRPMSERDDHLKDGYDYVLLDAPCTGLGVMRRHPEVKWRVADADVARIATTQRALLHRLSQHVRPGGLLVYSVCTFTYEEGPGQIRKFLAEHPDFYLQEPGAGPQSGAAIPWPELACPLTGKASPSPGTLATWPHRHDADAFFAARLRRRSADVRE